MFLSPEYKVRELTALQLGRFVPCPPVGFDRYVIHHLNHLAHNLKILFQGRQLGVTRTPVGFIDLDTKDGRILNVRPVAKSHAWKQVPTPEIF
jgi:hypothetical protein